MIVCSLLSLFCLPFGYFILHMMSTPNSFFLQNSIPESPYYTWKSSIKVRSIRAASVQEPRIKADKHLHREVFDVKIFDKSKPFRFDMSQTKEKRILKSKAEIDYKKL